MNHLGVIFDDAFGLFWVFGWISGKMDEISKSRQFPGPTLWCRDPMQQRDRQGGLDKPRRSTSHRHVFLSCFAIPLS